MSELLPTDPLPSKTCPEHYKSFEHMVRGQITSLHVWTRFVGIMEGRVDEERRATEADDSASSR